MLKNNQTKDYSMPFQVEMECLVCKKNIPFREKKYGKTKENIVVVNVLQ